MGPKIKARANGMKCIGSKSAGDRYEGIYHRRQLGYDLFKGKWHLMNDWSDAHKLAKLLRHAEKEGLPAARNMIEKITS